MKLSNLKLLLCLFLAVGLTHVRAQEDDEVEIFDVDEIAEEEDDYEIGPSQDVETAVLFPDYPDKRFELGEIIKVLFMVNNKGDMGFNVTHVFASLRSPYDYNYHIQNFSIMPVGTLVLPGRQASFEYLFKPDVSLEPTDFWLTAEVIYNSSEDRMYKSAIFNGTVELVEKNAEVDVTKVFKYLIGLAVVGFSIHYFYNMNNPKKSFAYTSAPTTTTYEDEVFSLKQQTKSEDGRAINRAVRRKASKNKKKSKKK